MEFKKWIICSFLCIEICTTKFTENALDNVWQKFSLR